MLESETALKCPAFT